MEDTNLKKSENKRAEYMREYMNRRYKQNPTYAKKYRRTCALMKKINIDEKLYKKYKEDIHHIYEIKRLIDDLNDGNFERFLMEYKTIQFEA